MCWLRLEDHLVFWFFRWSDSSAFFSRGVPTRELVADVDFVFIFPFPTCLGSEAGWGFLDEVSSPITSDA